MRLPLLLLFLLCLSIHSRAQTDSLQRDSVRKSTGHLRVSLWNEGRRINGANFYVGYRYNKLSPNLFRVNGIDFAITGFEHKVNGLAFSLLYSEVRKVNGVNISPLISDNYTINGVGLTGLVALYSDTTRGVMLTGFGTTGNYGSGVCISGLWNTFDDQFSGLVGSAFYNHMWGDMNGVEIAGAMNHQEKDVNGLAIAGIGSLVQGSARGMIVSGFFTTVAEDFYGFNVSPLVSWVGEESHGLQISLLNRCEVLQGSQVGMINSANRVQGVQLGLVNINRANPKWCRVTPFVNFNFNALHETDTIGGDVAGDYIVKSYHDNGRLASVKNFRNGTQDGMQYYYTEFGDLSLEVQYRNGRKYGLERRMMGADIESETEYVNDSIVAIIDRTYYETEAALQLVERNSGRGNYFSLLFRNDTLVSYWDKTGTKVYLTDVNFHGTFVSVSRNDSLQKVVWISSNIFSPAMGTVQQIYPFVNDSCHIDLGDSDGDQTDDFIKALNSILHDSSTAIRFVVRSRFAPEGTRHSQFVRDSLHHYDFYRCATTLNETRNGKWIRAEGCAATEYYPSGQVRSAVQYPCGEAHPYQRRDYYSSGAPAYYETFDTLIIYAKDGYVTRFDADSSATTYDEQGNVIYHVTFDSLMYFSKPGQLTCKGVNDTLWRYRSDGTLWRRIEVGRDTVLQIDYKNGRSDSLWFETWPYFRSGEGKSIRKMLKKEPVITSQALIDWEYEDAWYHNSRCTWYGIRILRWSEEDGERYWVRVDLSPIEESELMNELHEENR